VSDLGDHGSTTTIEAAAEHLAELRAFVRGALRERGVDEDTISDLIQAVDELGCNTIEHGYAGRPGTIETRVSREGMTVSVWMRDRAPGFDPRTVPEPRLDLPLRERPLGGMGVHLARTLTDRIDHRILPEGGNEIVLTKELRPNGPREESDGHHDGPADS
jgi:serine/threonine-protein kinase RsbW